MSNTHYNSNVTAPKQSGVMWTVVLVGGGTHHKHSAISLVRAFTSVFTVI